MEVVSTSKQQYKLVSTPNVEPVFTQARISFGVRGESYGWGGGTTAAGRNADFSAADYGDDYHGKVTWSNSNHTVTFFYDGSRHFHGEYQVWYRYPNGDTDNKNVVWDSNEYNITRTVNTSESQFLRTISEWKWASV